VILAPEIGAQMDETAPGFDARKRDLLHEMKKSTAV
jgi:hypothetical protein